MWWSLSLLDEWLKDRHAIKELDRHFKEFCKHHHYDERSQRWVKNNVDVAERLTPRSENIDGSRRATEPRPVGQSTSRSIDLPLARLD
jgi:hypothetical protein